MRRAALVLLFALASCDQKADGPKSVPETVANFEQEHPEGRFEIVNVPMTSQTILLDTKTGNTWYRISTGPDVERDITAWLPMDRMTFAEWVAMQAATQPRPAKP